MPPKKKPEPLPEGFLPHPVNPDQWSCRICQPAPAPPNWCVRKSLPSHLKSKIHCEAVSRNKEVEETRHRAREQACRERESVHSTQLLPTRIVGQGHSEVNTSISAYEREMWEHYQPESTVFDAGFDTDTMEREEIERQIKTLGLGVGSHLLGADIDEEEGNMFGSEAWMEDEEDEAALDEALSHLVDLNNDEDTSDSHTDVKPGAAWFPYDSKTMMLLDAFSNMPRAQVSDSVLKIIVWMMRMCGCHDVPSFQRLRLVQSKLRVEAGVPTLAQDSALGTKFHINDISCIIAQDWTNPNVRSRMQLYPEIRVDGLVKEMWHAEKWRTMDRHLLSPMYDAGHGRHYYIDELARLKSGELIIPMRWVIVNGVLHAEAARVSFDHLANASIDTTTVLVSTQDLSENYLDIEHQGPLPMWSAQAISTGLTKMPNPDRILAKGLPLYTSLIAYFADDVSGNRSKSWNKHINAYMTHLNLERKDLQHESNIHFISTSQHASAAEQFASVKTIVERTHKAPILVRDAATSADALFRLGVMCKPSDNPMQSEVCGHIGDKGNFPCRKCEVGGTKKTKESTETYEAFFKPQAPRLLAKVKANIQDQLAAACTGNAKLVATLQTETGTKDSFTQSWIERILARFREQQALGRQAVAIETELRMWVQEKGSSMYSSFLTLDHLEPAKDTPIELLHTVLLGPVKYIWHFSHLKWTEKEKEIFCQRLQATDTNALNVHAIRSKYIMQYAGSLIGRQLKTLMQINVFHVHGIVDEVRFEVWKALGQLGALLWFPEIDDMDRYCEQLELAVGNFLDSYAAFDPSKMIMKIKLHLLTHAPDDARRFGPLLGVITELFESYNAVFRFASISSNRLSPSRDIALTLAAQESVKHRISGGWWRHTSSDKSETWVQSGPSVRALMEDEPLLHRMFSWNLAAEVKAGMVRLAPISLSNGKRSRIRPTTSLSTFPSALAAVNVSDHDLSKPFYRCKSVAAQSYDWCEKGYWVFAKSPLEGSHDSIAGRIVEVLQPTENIKQSSSGSVIVLEQFLVGQERHSVFDMPCLYQPHDESKYWIISGETILFAFNAQHDCIEGQCKSSGQRATVQERLPTTFHESFIEHTNGNRFIINTASLHNPHLLRRILPTLTAITPRYTDPSQRSEAHQEWSRQLRDTREGKEQEKVEKKGGKKRKAADVAPTTEDIAAAGIRDDTNSGRRTRARTQQDPL